MRHRGALVLAVLLIAAGGAVRAQAQAAVPVHRRFTLRNGLLVTLIHTGTARRAAVALVLEAGEIDEPNFGPGLAALTAAMLLQGTVARPAATIAADAAAMGTRLAVQAGPVSTTISGDVETARVPAFLALVSDVVRHPLLDTASFGRARRDALDRLERAMHNPADLARQQWRAIIFPDGPYGQPYSYAATLRLLQLGHVRNMYDDDYAAARAHLYVSGVFDDAATERAVRDIFSDWKAGTPPRVHAVRAATVHELAIVDRPGADSSAVWIGCPTIDPSHADFAALEVADRLVAGDDSSRVAVRLARLAHAAPRGGSTLWEHPGATYWVDTLAVRAGDTGEAIGAVIGELDALRREAPSPAAVARARRSVMESFTARETSRDGIIALMEYVDEHGLGDHWLAEHPGRVEAVTADDVRAAATAWLDPAHMAIVIVGDRAAIEPGLAKLGPVVP